MAVQSQEKPAPRPRVRFNYIKTESYKEVAAHGVLGSPTPQGKLWMAFFSERHPLPQVVEFEGDTDANNPNLTTIDESKQPAYIESKTGVVRNVEVGVYMDRELAQRLHTWLGEQIKAMTPGTIS